jgi:hypothetical protein
MGTVLKLFMWGYQEHYRIFMESKAKRVLQELAPSLHPQALLIGVQAPDASAEEKQHPPICVVPENQEWDPAIFRRCAQRTEEIFKDHPDHDMLFGDEPRMRDKPENIRKASAYAAVREVFDGYDQAHATKTFCAYPVKLCGYYVVPALQFNKTDLDEYPCLAEPIEFHEFRLSGGFLDCVIRQLLREAQRGLGTREPGRFFDVLDTDSEAILRKAGDEFCSVLLLASKDMMFQGTFGYLNAIAALRYEGAAGSGALVVAPSGHPAVELKVEFPRAVPLDEPRWARKILEMSRNDLCCICNGAAGLRGLGALKDMNADGVFSVDFIGHFKWQLRHKGKILLQSLYGVPRLPRATIKEQAFKSTFRRLFSGVDTEAQEYLWRVVLAATGQRHGTMIVISDRAAEESKRLANQGMPVAPVQLSANLVQQVSGIDGAILVDRHGTCHAIGVILDGMATDEGNAARGARYNSALRYLTTRGEVPTLLVVISEDGTVDMIPTLRPQIARSLIERKIVQLKQCDIDSYAKTRNWLCEHRFYLDAEQCRVVNDEIARIESVPLEPCELRGGTAQFVPDPEMDESYYLPRIGA